MASDFLWITTRIVHLLKRYWSWSAPERVLILQAAALTLLIRGLLSFVSLRTVVRLLRRWADRLSSEEAANRTYRARVVWAASAVAGRLLPKRPCLTQALVVQFLLRRRGDNAATLRIGVAKDGDFGIAAHAWVEREGEVIIGGTDSPHRYRPLPEVESKIMGR